jgi:hypothetical protein
MENSLEFLSVIYMYRHMYVTYLSVTTWNKILMWLWISFGISSLGPEQVLEILVATFDFLFSSLDSLRVTFHVAVWSLTASCANIYHRFWQDTIQGERDVQFNDFVAIYLCQAVLCQASPDSKCVLIWRRSPTAVAHFTGRCIDQGWILQALI